VTTVVARAGHRAGLGTVHAHRLRHAAATELPRCFRTPGYWVSGCFLARVVLVQHFLWGSVPA
jgi:hypothetical protein